MEVRVLAETKHCRYAATDLLVLLQVAGEVEGKGASRLVQLVIMVDGEQQFSKPFLEA